MSGTAGVGVWHASVRITIYSIRTASGSRLLPGSVFAHREAQRRVDDECVVAKSLPSGTALPVAQLVCNFTARWATRLAADA